MPPPPSLPADVLAAVPAVVQAYIQYLEGRLAELEARLDQNSTNSSKPPSSDGPHVKPPPPKSPSGRKRGGQQGHPKHDRVILPPDEVIDHKPAHCRGCHAALTGDDPQPLIEQVIELPVKRRHVTHHRRHTLLCACCHALTTAPAVPAAASGFGPTLTAVTAYLSGVGRLSKRTIRTLYADVFGIPVSVGMVSKHEARVSRALEPIHAEAHAHTQGQNANVDETGWKQGKSKAWLWVAVAGWVTVFLIRPKRNRVAFDDLVGPKPGILTTDRYGVYTHLEGESRQVCWAHLRRDFQAMIDRKDAGSAVGESLLKQADEVLRRWRLVREGTSSRATFLVDLPALRAEFDATLLRGEGCGCVKTVGVCAELRRVGGGLWVFGRVAGVEPTNNAAERAVRHAVCWRKTSFGTDSERGSRFVERILTVVATCRQQSRGVLDFLVQALNANHKPSLLPKGV